MAGSASGAIESLAVVDYDVVDGNSKFTLFVVEVRVGAETHLVHRR